MTPASLKQYIFVESGNDKMLITKVKPIQNLNSQETAHISPSQVVTGCLLWISWKYDWDIENALYMLT